MKTVIPFEIKSRDEGKIEGHGSIFGNVDLGGDIVLPGAFKRSLSEHKANGTMPALLWQHSSSDPIGVWEEAFEDEDGLFMRGRIADTSLGRDAKILIGMKAVRGLSIGFQLMDFDFDKQGNRLIKEADLWETSVVTFPMNPKAQVEAIKSQFPNVRDFEKHLRDVGCSHKVAKIVCSDLFGSSVTKDADLRDVDEVDVSTIQSINQILEAGAFRNKRKQLRL